MLDHGAVSRYGADVHYSQELKEVDEANKVARFGNIWGLGDVMNTPNAKSMAAVRKQVPVVAQNICDVMQGADLDRAYDGTDPVR